MFILTGTPYLPLEHSTSSHTWLSTSLSLPCLLTLVGLLPIPQGSAQKPSSFSGHQQEARAPSPGCPSIFELYGHDLYSPPHLQGSNELVSEILAFPAPSMFLDLSVQVCWMDR